MSSMDYDLAKRKAFSPDRAERRQVADAVGAQPEILYLLASDREAVVRRAVASNAATPRQADLLLSTDPDEGVRSQLAVKIAALMPSLSNSQVGQFERMTLEILETLARDQTVAIRATLADAVKSLPNAPPSVVQQLARDLEIQVSGPVLRHSPLLTDDDLLAIIQGLPADDKLCAIAERAGVSSAVSDAIVRTESEAAVTSLLGNPSAQIREETLDRILDMAPRHEPWHAPLVRRPALPAAAVARIAGFVTDSLLKVLEARTDLSAQARTALTQAVKQRAAVINMDDGDGHQIRLVEEPPRERPADRARRLDKEGKLDEEVVLGGLGQGDRGFVLTALSLLSGLSATIVDKIATSQSPRAVTALAWKAGLSMRGARQLQLRLAQVPPTKVLNARDGTHYPMTPDELQWQLDFFGA